MKIPATASYDTGRQMFLQRCAHCHGVAGDGTGWAGQYLNPKPADLRKIAARKSGDLSTIEGEYQSKLSFGIKDSAMPAWGEFLPQGERWDDVRFVLDSFLTGKKVTTSQHVPGALPTQYVRTDTGIFQSEIATIDPLRVSRSTSGIALRCHGAGVYRQRPRHRRLGERLARRLPEGHGRPVRVLPRARRCLGQQ